MTRNEIAAVGIVFWLLLGAMFAMGYLTGRASVDVPVIIECAYDEYLFRDRCLSFWDDN